MVWKQTLSFAFSALFCVSGYNYGFTWSIEFTGRFNEYEYLDIRIWIQPTEVSLAAAAKSGEIKIDLLLPHEALRSYTWALS